MIDLEKANNLWHNFQPIKGVTFGLNDAVRIKSGEYAGQAASVISLVSVEPVIIYAAELGTDGSTVEVSQTEIESL